MPNEQPPTDFAPFRRTALVNSRWQLGIGSMTAVLELDAVARTAHGVNPDLLSVEALRLLSSVPEVYMAEQTITGIVRRPDLYTVQHDDPRMVAEVEEWLWPLLGVLCGAAARAFAYGTVAVVLDVERRTIRVRAARDSSSPARNRTLVDHTHFYRAHELHPDLCQVLTDEAGAFAAVEFGGRSYDAGRAHLWAWDPEFGSLAGQAARRRAWRAICEAAIVSVLEAKYLERSVDSPRVVRAPAGKVPGTDQDALEFAVELVSSLTGGGQAGLPSERDASGNYYYDVAPLELPDRADVWEKAIHRRERKVMLAYLVGPALGGISDAGASDGRTLDSMLREFVDNLATWVAGGLTRIVELVHAANYTRDVAAPRIVATDVGKAAARRMLKEVLGLVNANAAGEIARTVDVPAALDRLGVPVRDPESAPEADAGGARPVGRPRDELGDRQERRERSTTDEGEDDTGGPREEATGE
jgi:hypothetical protein